MPSYAELNALPPEAFLNSENFRTPNDGLPKPGYAEEQYKNGLTIGRESYEVGVNANGTWFANSKDGGVLTSYEGIGYHSCTAQLWKGFLDSGVEIVIYRNNACPTGIGRYRLNRETQTAEKLA